MRLKPSSRSSLIMCCGFVLQHSAALPWRRYSAGSSIAIRACSNTVMATNFRRSFCASHAPGSAEPGFVSQSLTQCDSEATCRSAWIRRCYLLSTRWPSYFTLGSLDFFGCIACVLLMKYLSCLMRYCQSHAQSRNRMLNSRYVPCEL